MVQKRILIEGRPLWVGVYHEEPGEWIAVGDAEGELLTLSGRSEREVLKLWEQQAVARARTSPPVGRLMRDLPE